MSAIRISRALSWNSLNRSSMNSSGRSRFALRWFINSGFFILGRCDTSAEDAIGSSVMSSLLPLQVVNHEFRNGLLGDILMLILVRVLMVFVLLDCFQDLFQIVFFHRPNHSHAPY